MTGYAGRELPYCDALAAALLGDPAFRVWFCGGHPLAAGLAEATADAETARRLRRKVPAGDRWWFNHWAGAGPGIESDILIIFIRPDGQRIALHVEVKDDSGRLLAGQAEGYARRVRSWADAATRPASVPPHGAALAVLVCGDAAAADPAASLFAAVHRHSALRQRVAGYPGA